MAKLILTHEVTGLGTPGDVVEVKNGYARNYLIPQGFAVAWTRGGEKQVEQIKAARAARELALARRGAGPQGQARVEQGQAGRQGRPRGPPVRLGQDRRMSRMRSRPPASATLDKRKIEISTPIKAVGEHEATVRLRDELSRHDHPPGGRGEVARTARQTAVGLRPGRRFVVPRGRGAHARVAGARSPRRSERHASSYTFCCTPRRKSFGFP